MNRIAASETKTVTTIAFDGRDNLIEILVRDVAFHSKLAVGSRTPSKHATIVHISTIE
jgi:hypothetical protein